MSLRLPITSDSLPSRDCRSTQRTKLQSCKPQAPLRADAQEVSGTQVHTGLSLSSAWHTGRRGRGHGPVVLAPESTPKSLPPQSPPGPEAAQDQEADGCDSKPHRLSPSGGVTRATWAPVKVNSAHSSDPPHGPSTPGISAPDTPPSCGSPMLQKPHGQT